MHPNEVLAALRRKPFVPFRLYVADGSAYEIRHPEVLLLTQSAAYVGLGAPGTIPDRAVTISLGHVSRLEELSAPANPGNGQAGS